MVLCMAAHSSILGIPLNAFFPLLFFIHSSSVTGVAIDPQTVLENHTLWMVWHSITELQLHTCLPTFMYVFSKVGGNPHRHLENIYCFNLLTFEKCTNCPIAPKKRLKRKPRIFTLTKKKTESYIL